MLERFSIVCRGTKTKILLWPSTTDAEQMNQSEFQTNTYVTVTLQLPSAGKRVRASHDLIWSRFSLGEKVARFY